MVVHKFLIQTYCKKCDILKCPVKSMYHTMNYITLFATLSEVLNASIPCDDWNYGSLHAFISKESQNTTSVHYIHHFPIYSDYCIFTISRLSQWYEINVLYLCFICYCTCCQLHTQSSYWWHCTVIKSVTLMCRSTFRRKKPFVVKIQYVDGRKRECIMYRQRCRNYAKLGCINRFTVFL